MRDDLNTPVALAEFNRVARELARAENQADARRAAAELLADADFIGLLQSSPDEWFGSAEDAAGSAEIEQLIEQRNQARAARDFATADAIRDRLSGMGVLLEDADGKPLAKDIPASMFYHILVMVQELSRSAKKIRKSNSKSFKGSS